MLLETFDSCSSGRFTFESRYPSTTSVIQRDFNGRLLCLKGGDTLVEPKLSALYKFTECQPSGTENIKIQEVLDTHNPLKFPRMKI